MGEYLIYCVDCDEYSLLGKYLKKRKHFQGEYSLLHNCHIETSELLCRFLMEHINHSIKVLSDKEETYPDILKASNHFLEDDIEKFVSETLNQKKAKESNLTMERGLGQLQLNILMGMLKEEIKTISKKSSNVSAESQFLLGKEEGLKKAQELLDELMKKTNTLYKTV